jgi:hypothetical protein
MFYFAAFGRSCSDSYRQLCKILREYRARGFATFREALRSGYAGLNLQSGTQSKADMAVACVNAPTPQRPLSPVEHFEDI